MSPPFTIFYLYYCKVFPTDFFVSTFAHPPTVLFFTWWTAWSFKNALSFHITPLLQVVWQLPILLIIHPKLLTMAYKGLCAPNSLQACLLPHSPLVHYVPATLALLFSEWRKLFSCLRAFMLSFFFFFFFLPVLLFP